MINAFRKFIFAIIIYAVATGGVQNLKSIFLRIYIGLSTNEYADYSLEDVDSLQSRIVNGKPSVLYIHGFTENVENESVRTVVQAYLKRKDHNVMAADYGKFSNDSYVKVVRNIPRIATALATALNKMVNSGFDAEKLHIVGHSLGSHVAGFIGRKVNFKIPRITGLDPAGPLYNILEPRLSRFDARFVDIIHTDFGFYGIARTTGTVDFFPNGGHRIQPGCPLNATIYSKEDFCSHHRSWRFYAESLNDEIFLGLQCSSLDHFTSGKCNSNAQFVMGYGTPNKARGTFYLVTADHSPFGLRKKGLIS